MILEGKQIGYVFTGSFCTFKKSIEQLKKIDKQKEEDICKKHTKNSKAVFYRINGCTDCPFIAYCKRYMKNQLEDFKI